MGWGLLAGPFSSRLASPRGRGSGTRRFSSVPRWPAICSCARFASARQDRPSALSSMSPTATLPPRTHPVFLAPMVLPQRFRPCCSPQRQPGGHCGTAFSSSDHRPVPPLCIRVSAALLMIGALLASMPLLIAWLDGREAARWAPWNLALGGLLLALACSYWLVPAILELKIVATSALASPSHWTWSEGPGHAHQWVLAEQRLGLEIRCILPVRRCLRQVPAA